MGHARVTAVALLTFLILGVRPLAAQELAHPTEEITVARGNSAVIVNPGTLERVSIGNPDIADAVVVSANEVVVNGKAPGTTSLLLWSGAGVRRMYTVRVTADAPALERQLRRLYPETGIEASAMGNTVILTGDVEDPRVADKAMELARTLGEGVVVVNNIVVPERGQVLLRVRFAEVSRNAMKELGPELFLYEDENVSGALGTGDNIRTADRDDDAIAEAFSDAVNFFLFHRPSGVAGFINALKSRGIFKSLAEPNLLAMPGDTASFLAGGEFPFPVLQGGGQSNAVTIQFKEFGIRLNFVPFITNSGAIRLFVRPEVSSLDFANGLQIGGFNIPSLLARRASTVIELADGQTFAIAGLVDNSLTESASKVPILGDIPILGALFRSEEMRQNRSELLVLVTPEIVRPLDRAPPVPTGEPEIWRWEKSMQDSTYRGSGSGTEGGTP